MKAFMLALIATGALSIASVTPDTAEARPRGYYGRGGVSVNVGRNYGYRRYNYRPYYRYGYRPYYYNYGYRPYYYRSYRPYYYGSPYYGRSYYYGSRPGIYIGF